MTPGWTSSTDFLFLLTFLLIIWPKGIDLFVAFDMPCQFAFWKAATNSQS